MKMEIWCGRSSDGTFRMYIADDTANCRFVEVKMTPHNFACMLANMPVECEGEVMNLERVGKKQVREHRSLPYKGKDRDKEVIRKWLRKKHEGDGWEINDSLNSQNSVVFDQKIQQYVVNYTMEKWV